jgi:hypothetical protein
MPEDSRADQIGDAIVGEHGIDDDSVSIEKSPVGDDSELGPKEYPQDEEDLTGSAESGEGEAAAEGDAGSDGTGKSTESEPLLANQFPMTPEGIVKLEDAALGHQSARDKAETTLRNAGYTRDDNGNWVPPADRGGERVPERVRGKGFNAERIARKLLESTVKNETVDVEIPEDYDPTNPAHLVQLVKGVLKSERAIDDQFRDVQADLIELQEYFPDVSLEDLEETLDFVDQGGLSLVAAHAIRTGGISKFQRQSRDGEGSDKVGEEKKVNPRTAAALEELRQAREKTGRPIPGTGSAGAGSHVEEEEKSLPDQIGDDIVESAQTGRRKRI